MYLQALIVRYLDVFGIWTGGEIPLGGTKIISCLKCICPLVVSSVLTAASWYQLRLSLFSLCGQPLEHHVESLTSGDWWKHGACIPDTVPCSHGFVCPEHFWNVFFFFCNIWRLTRFSLGNSRVRRDDDTKAEESSPLHSRRMIVCEWGPKVLSAFISLVSST